MGSNITHAPPEPKIQIQPAGKHRCDFCGEHGQTVDAKLYLFPFVVDPGKFGNFYSQARRGLKMCARCALAGFAAFESWLWQRQGASYHFFLFHTDMPINPELLRVEQGERIAGAPWNRAKTLLAIHAMNAYLRKKFPVHASTTEQGGERSAKRSL